MIFLLVYKTQKVPVPKCVSYVPDVAGNRHLYLSDDLLNSDNVTIDWWVYDQLINLSLSLVKTRICLGGSTAACTLFVQANDELVRMQAWEDTE